MVVKTDSSLKGKNQVDHNNKPSGVLNRTGPWLCSTCNAAIPLIFDTYFNYRKHLRVSFHHVIQSCWVKVGIDIILNIVFLIIFQEVHNEKVDVRICEHCGHRANKRNLLLYHLYKVHGIAPPPSCKFPKCDLCNHISLSEVLLAKHKDVHAMNKEFQCSMCHAAFKYHSALQSHLENSQRCNPRKKVGAIQS